MDIIIVKSKEVKYIYDLNTNMTRNKLYDLSLYIKVKMIKVSQLYVNNKT